MKRLSYKDAGIDINATDVVKQRIAESIASDDHRILNKLGAFAALVDGSFPDIRDPVLVLKMEEPGSKQELAFQSGRIEDLARDLVHHLINDIAVMGAHPLYVLDCIVCGKLEPGVVERLVSAMAEACRDQGCALVGGETSVQPGVLAEGSYILSASVVGVTDRSEVIDGSRIQPGDVLLAVESNGLHTNGFSLLRALLREKPEVAEIRLGTEKLLDVAMRPHTAYYPSLRSLFTHPGLRGLAHITGGGLKDNVARILPSSVRARIDLRTLRIPAIFHAIQQHGSVTEADMLRTFNLGCGLVMVCEAAAVDAIGGHFTEHGLASWPIGDVIRGEGEVEYIGNIAWEAGA